MIRPFTILGMALFASCLAIPSLSADPAPAGGMAVENPGRAPAPQSSTAPEMAWWRDAKFGMFIHWGVYAVPATGEWYMNQKKTPVAEYKQYAKQFNPVKYDPDAWVRMAKEAGMKYIVITAKHHDGFAMFYSQASDWNIVRATPYGKDVLQPLAEACRKQGIKLGFYYSQGQDWTNGGGAIGGKWDPAQQRNMDDYLDKVAVPQVRELLSNYGPDTPFALWWDTPTDITPARSQRLQDVVTALRSNTLQNDRRGGGFYGNYRTPEQFVPVAGISGDWETCMTMNGSWGYASWDKAWKSPTVLIRKLADIASKGGNLLLNVGPTAEGEFPPESQERLAAIGRWMKANGESIYGTTAGPFANLNWGRATRKGDLLYLHVFQWPKDGVLRVPLLSGVKAAWMLGAPEQKLSFSREAARTLVGVPEVAPDQSDSVVVLQLGEEPKVPRLPTLGATATSTSAQPGNGPENLFDGTVNKRWIAAPDVQTASVEIDLGREFQIGGFGFDEPDVWPRMRQTFTLEALLNGTWQQVAAGKTVGHGEVASFPQVSARRFRLSMTCEKGAPGVAEFQLYEAE